MIDSYPLSRLPEAIIPYMMDPRKFSLAVWAIAISNERSLSVGFKLIGYGERLAVR